jgi:hypothetical protein
MLCNKGSGIELNGMELNYPTRYRAQLGLIGKATIALGASGGSIPAPNTLATLAPLFPRKSPVAPTNYYYYSVRSKSPSVDTNVYLYGVVSRSLSSLH